MNENTIKEVYTDFLNKRNVNEKDIVSYECVNQFNANVELDDSILIQMRNGQVRMF